MAAPFTEDEFLALGLDIAGGTGRSSKETNINRFKKFYGPTPATFAAVWEKLRSTDDDTIKLTNKDKPRDLLLGVRFLWGYETEDNLGNHFGIRSRTTVARICEIWTFKVQTLLKDVSLHFYILCTKLCRVLTECFFVVDAWQPFGS